MNWRYGSVLGCELEVWSPSKESDVRSVLQNHFQGHVGKDRGIHLASAWLFLLGCFDAADSHKKPREGSKWHRTKRTLQSKARHELSYSVQPLGKS